ncbi:MAG: hypothetical protein A2138_27810 [Deltaproteobacteria bacterium RBG_16_71_12]|nr:MAG: hypothetical protein A2138_27810 [Deltaproteobacteria bacterium RBG_16_71_12]
MNDAKPKPPLPDELLDRGIGLLEGPANRLAERLLSSTIVLAPLSLSMTLGMRVAAKLRGAKHQHADARSGERRPQ